MSLVTNFAKEKDPLKYKVYQLERRIEELEKKFDIEVCVKRGRKKKEAQFKTVRDIIFIEQENEFENEIIECILLETASVKKGDVIEIERSNYEQLIADIMNSEIGESIYFDKYINKNGEARKDELGDWVLESSESPKKSKKK